MTSSCWYWLAARDEADSLLSKYIPTKLITAEDPNLPIPERTIDIEDVYLIAKAKQKEQDCMEAFLKVARERVGATP